MESTRLPTAVAALSAAALEQEDRLQSVYALFAAVPDPRSRHGRRYTLPFLLTCVVAALLCNSNSQDAIAQWCREQRALLRRLFPGQRWHTPSGSLFRKLLPRLDAEQMEAALARWI